MKYGIRDTMLKATLEDTFKAASEIGFDGVEFCIGAEYRDNVLWQDGGIDKLKGLADAAKVEISSLSPGVFSRFHPALPEADLRKEGVEILTHVIECCQPLDTNQILVPMFPKDMYDWPDTTWTQLSDGLKALSDVAGKRGVTLNLEATFDADQYVRIVDAVSSDHLKVYHDTGNTMMRDQDPALEIRKLGPSRVGMIHAKDTDRQALGDGRVDFDDVDAAIREIDYDGYIVLETPVGDDPAADNAKNLKFVRKLGV